MDKNFLLFRERIERIVCHSQRPNKRLVAEELIQVWERLHSQGVDAFDFAHVAVLASEAAMQTYDTLDEFQKFGKHLQERGASVVRCVSEYWPPVDPNKWPEKPPSWLEGGN